MKQFLRFAIAFLMVVSLKAQTIQIEQVNNSTGWMKVVPEGQTVHFPTAASATPTLSFLIRNTGTETLVINSFFLEGANLTHFTISGLTTLSIEPNGQSPFDLIYTPPTQFTQQSSASLVFNTNASGSPTYTLNFKGPGVGLYGPTYPTYGELVLSFSNPCPQGNNCIGRSSGTSVTFSVVEQAERTDTYRGTVVGSDGDIWIRTSLDGSSYSGEENFTFSPADSDLEAGILVHRGVSITNTVSGDLTVYLKYTETLTKADGVTPYTCIDPTTLGLSEELGGLAKFDNSTDVLNAHSIITASFDYDGPFEPFLDFYEAIPDKTCDCAFYSINKGFYWENLNPEVLVNDTLQVEPGETMPITTDILNVHDDEELPANPQNVVIDFNDTNPLSFNSGVLRLDGVQLSGSDSFTLADLQNGLLTYENTDTEALEDVFEFRVSDSRGEYADNSGSPVFAFNLTIGGGVSVNDISNPSSINGFRANFNPAANEITVRFTPTETDKAVINLYALDGSKAVSVFDGPIAASVQYSLPFSVQQLPSGVYMLVLQTQHGDVKRAKISVVR